MNNCCDVCKENVKLANKVLCEENDELKETVEKYSKTITANLGEIEKLENENEELNKRIKSLEKIVDHRDYCRTNLRERCKKLESEVMDCNDMYYSLLDENKELKSHIEDLELEITRLTFVNSVYNDADKEFTKVKLKLKKEIAELEKEVEDLNNIIKWNNDVYASLLDENKELKDKIKMFEEGDKYKNSTFSDLLVHHDFLVDQNAKLKEENSKLLDTLVEKEKYIEKLEHEHTERINTLEKALLDSDKRFNIMADKAKKFDSLLDELEALVDEYNE